MAGRLALDAEIFGCGDEASAEIGLPHAIDKDARGRGSFAIDEPARQRQARRLTLLGKRLEEGGDAGGHRARGFEPVAAA